MSLPETIEEIDNAITVAELAILLHLSSNSFV